MDAVTTLAPAITRPDPNAPIFRVEGRDRIFVRSGSEFPTENGGRTIIDIDQEVMCETLVAGQDYYVHRAVMNRYEAIPAPNLEIGDRVLGGFHFAPGGNASARAGGDALPAINPFSIWDAGFRPACPDPRGMTQVTPPGGKPFWCDIYLLGVDHIDGGTSRHGVAIADGYKSLPRKPGKGTHKALDFPTAVEIMAAHGKQLLTYDEFRAAAFGVTEKSAAGDKPKLTGLDAPRSSRCGVMQSTGNLWVWGTDGDPDEPGASLFGGSWISDRSAGSRYACLDRWPDDSSGGLGARGRCDHMQPA